MLFSWLLMTALVLTSCRTSSLVNTGPVRSLNREWRKLNLAEQEHVGLSISDVQSGKKIFGYKDDNYFTPGSNIKILTMYASLYILKDQLDAARYTTYGDSLLIWGGGDPGTKYPVTDASSALTDFITASGKRIFFSNSHFQTTRFGSGWAWDDYAFTYQCERNAFPMYGNRLWIDRHEDTIKLTPAYLLPILKIATDTISKTGKSEWGEGYTYTYDAKQKNDHKQIPITFFRNDIQNEWSEATGKPITMIERPLPLETLTIRGSSRDTLLKIMMRNSDNFIAEQLLLACSLKKLNYMAENIFIDTMLRGPLHTMPDKIQWIDGSGLSRYNQVTPRSMVWMLRQIYDLKGLSYIKSIFPAGGQSGNLRDLYKGKNGLPYIYAKTGTLRHINCLSGYLLTRSGKILIFSWMNNQYPGDQKDLKMKMEKLFSFLCDHY